LFVGDKDHSIGFMFDVGHEFSVESAGNMKGDIANQ
jgi:hypothetical protein